MFRKQFVVGAIVVVVGAVGVSSAIAAQSKPHSGFGAVSDAGVELVTETLEHDRMALGSRDGWLLISRIGDRSEQVICVDAIKDDVTMTYCADAALVQTGRATSAYRYDERSPAVMWGIVPDGVETVEVDGVGDVKVDQNVWLVTTDTVRQVQVTGPLGQSATSFRSR